MNNTITIVGGGIVGLTLAALLVKNDFSVSIIESNSFCVDEKKLTARVSAIHLTARHVFQYLDVWPSLEKNATPLYDIKIWDHTQQAHLHFDSRDVHEKQMGFIIENRAMIKTLHEKLLQDDRVTFFCPASPVDFCFAKNKDDLIVGADGANSWVRQQMPITLKTRAYQQKSIIAVIESEKPHHNRAIQKFLTTGPVALLPLTKPHHTALVWSADDAISDALMEKSDDDFSQCLTEALDFTQGKLTVISERSQFPLIMRHVSDYVAENFALVGDAAHTIHPLAGLGVNLGIMDAACLTQTLIDARHHQKSLGDYRVLRRYSRWRQSENIPVICAMRALQEVFAIDTHTVNLMRSLGVNAIDQCSTLKHQLMEVAMGKSSDLPAFLQTPYRY